MRSDSFQARWSWKGELFKETSRNFDGVFSKGIARSFLILHNQRAKMARNAFFHLWQSRRLHPFSHGLHQRKPWPFPSCAGLLQNALLCIVFEGCMKATWHNLILLLEHSTVSVPFGTSLVLHTKYWKCFNCIIILKSLNGLVPNCLGAMPFHADSKHLMFRDIAGDRAYVDALRQEGHNFLMETPWLWNYMTR